MFNVFTLVLGFLTISDAAVTSPSPVHIFQPDQMSGAKLTTTQSNLIKLALPLKSTPESRFVENFLLLMLVAKSEQQLQTGLSLADFFYRYKMMIDLRGISSDVMLTELSLNNQDIFAPSKFQGSGITLQNGRMMERTPSWGRSLRGIFATVDRRFVLLLDGAQIKIIARDFGNMRDGARSGLLMSLAPFGQPGKDVFTVKLDPQLLAYYKQVRAKFYALSDEMKRQFINRIVRLSISPQGRLEKQNILNDLLRFNNPIKRSLSREIIIAEPTLEPLSCPRNVQKEVARMPIPDNSASLIQVMRDENVDGMVIRTPKVGEKIIAIDFSKIPDQAQREYMQLMADLVRHKVEDPTLSHDERQAIIDGFQSDVKEMMRTGTFNPVAHRTFSSIFAEYTLYNTLSLGLGKLPWAMGMLQSSFVETTVAPPVKFLDTTITAATCTAALPGLAGQMTQRRLDPYALVKEEGQTRFGATRPDIVEQYKPSAAMQGAAYACSAAAGMIVAYGCNTALASAGLDDGGTTAVLAAGAILVAKSAAEAAMLHAPTQKRIESVVRPAVGVSRKALSWLWGATQKIAATIGEVPEYGDDDVHLF